MSVVIAKHEVRLAVDGFLFNEGVVPFVVGLIERWLAEPVQFDKDYLIDIENFAWEGFGSSGNSKVRPLRIECVSAGSGRAIRFFFRDSDKNEIRVRTII